MRRVKRRFVSLIFSFSWFSWSELCLVDLLMMFKGPSNVSLSSPSPPFPRLLYPLSIIISLISRNGYQDPF